MSVVVVFLPYTKRSMGSPVALDPTDFIWLKQLFCVSTYFSTYHVVYIVSQNMSHITIIDGIVRSVPFEDSVGVCVHSCVTSNSAAMCLSSETHAIGQKSDNSC